MNPLQMRYFFRCNDFEELDSILNCIVRILNPKGWTPVRIRDLGTPVRRSVDVPIEIDDVTTRAASKATSNMLRTHADTCGKSSEHVPNNIASKR